MRRLFAATVLAGITLAALAPTAQGEKPVVRPAGGPVGPVWRWEPPTLEVSAGTTVTWENDGSAPHTVTAYDGPWEDDIDLPAGATAKRKFKKAGVYSYYCTTASHAVLAGTTCFGMCGTITVD